MEKNIESRLIKCGIHYSISAVLIEPGPRRAPNSAKIPKTNVPKDTEGEDKRDNWSKKY
jgi:hypothetical protein